MVPIEMLKGMPSWFLRLVLWVLLAGFGITSVYGARQAHAWVELVSQHIAQSSGGYVRIERLESRTNRMEEVLLQLRADQLSKYMWDAMKANPPDSAKAAEWEVQLRQLLMEQAAQGRIVRP